MQRKNLNAMVEKVIEHVTENIRNQEKLSMDMKRFRKDKKLHLKRYQPIKEEAVEEEDNNE